MDGISILILLENKNRRTFMIVRIIFNQLSYIHTGDNITDKKVIGREFVITMGRNLYFALLDETNNIIQRVAHIAIIDEAAQCVNEKYMALAFVRGGV